jgi:hypothetical protein
MGKCLRALRGGAEHKLLLTATSTVVLNVPQLFIEREKVPVIKCNLHRVYKQSAKDQPLQEMLLDWMDGRLSDITECLRQSQLITER